MISGVHSRGVEPHTVASKRMISGVQSHGVRPPTVASERMIPGFIPRWGDSVLGCSPRRAFPVSPAGGARRDGHFRRSRGRRISLTELGHPLGHTLRRRKNDLWIYSRWGRFSSRLLAQTGIPGVSRERGLGVTGISGVCRRRRIGVTGISGVSCGRGHSSHMICFVRVSCVSCVSLVFVFVGASVRL